MTGLVCRLRVAVREGTIGEQHCKALEPCLAASTSFSRAPVPSACCAATIPLIPPPHSPRARSWKRSGYQTDTLVFHTAKVALCSLALRWPLYLLQGVFGNLGFLFLFPPVGSSPFFSPLLCPEPAVSSCEQEILARKTWALLYHL